MNINIPGLGNSDDKHWQTLWEKDHPDKFFRVEQLDWENPDCQTWIDRIEEQLKGFNKEELVLIGHSVGCATIIKWHEKYGHKIKGALLVAPSDVDQPNYPKYITGFKPMPTKRLPFRTIVVSSSNDHVVSLDRSRYFAKVWGSQFLELENAGHIESKSGFGKWEKGLELVRELHRQPVRIGQ